MALRQEAALRLSRLVAAAGLSSGSDGDRSLVYLIAGVACVLAPVEERGEALLLVVLQQRYADGGRDHQCECREPDRKAAEVVSKYIIVDMYAKAVQGTKAEDAVKWAEGELKKIYEG